MSRCAKLRAAIIGLMAAPRPPLGGLSPPAFLRGSWQKRPLLVRPAIPGLSGLIDKSSLCKLAARDGGEARLGERQSAWRVTDGPFGRRTLSSLPESRWTLLVNGLNLPSKEADALLQRFA